MAVDPVPAVIHGAKHSADVFRQWIYDSTSGAAGVSTPGAMNVRQTGTPSNQVRVLPGGVLIPNTYSGGAGQSYNGRNASETLVSVPASDSTGSKSWYIIFRIQDPQFGGQAPADPTVGPYSFLECVSTSATISHPHYKLAKITVPASTATITNNMIEDLRKVANPLTKRVLRTRATLSGTGEWADKEEADGEYFPNAGGEQLIEIPEEATRAKIVAKWLSVRYEGTRMGHGEMWVEFGPYLRPSTRRHSTQRFMYDTVGAVANTYRDKWEIADDVYIPADIRGTTQVFVMKARKAPGTQTVASIDGMSGVVLDVLFEQVADPSTS